MTSYRWTAALAGAASMAAVPAGAVTTILDFDAAEACAAARRRRPLARATA